jgi:hypothetical protein
VNHAPRPLAPPPLPRERNPVLVDQENGCHPETVYMFRRTKISLALAGFEPWIVQPVAQYAIPNQEAQRNLIKNKYKHEHVNFNASFNKSTLLCTTLRKKLSSKRHVQKLGLVLRIAFAEIHIDTPLHSAQKTPTYRSVPSAVVFRRRMR